MLSPRPNEETRAYATKHYTEILERNVVVSLWCVSVSFGLVVVVKTFLKWLFH